MPGGMRHQEMASPPGRQDQPWLVSRGKPNFDDRGAGSASSSGKPKLASPGSVLADSVLRPKRDERGAALLFSKGKPNDRFKSELEVIG